MYKGHKGLKIPQSFLDATPELISEVCNGMGAKNSLISRWIPNTMYGLDVEVAGDIHDWGYHMGLTQEDKDEADDDFLSNMFQIINDKGGWLAPLRRRRALKYYEAVIYLGDDAFWVDKGESK